VQLPNLKPTPHRIGHLGALQGCLECLGRGVHPSWLFGATGYAFMLNVFKGVHWVGPTGWDTMSIKERMSNLGVNTDSYLLAWANQPDWQQKRVRAVEFLRDRLTAGVPCYGCELSQPGYFTIHGFDDEGFMYVWANLVDGQLYQVQRVWGAIGSGDMGMLLVGSVEPIETTPDNVKTVRDALRFAIEVATAEEGALSGASVGLRGYDTWATSLEDGSWQQNPWCHPFGTGNNAACWYECRAHAAVFLQLVGQYVPKAPASVIAQAVKFYQAIAAELAKVAQLFPYANAPPPTPQTIAIAAQALRTAKASEERAVHLLERIANSL
jgi:hypothetical protein